MKQRFRNLTPELCIEAVTSCFAHGKFRRNDVLTDVEEWTGYSREEILKAMDGPPKEWKKLKDKIIESRGYALYDMVLDICNGVDPDFDPVQITTRKDGITQKERDIAYLSIRMQLLGHVIKCGIEPLLNARITPWQFASIPGRGPKLLVTKLQRKLKRNPDIKYAVKTDCAKAYRSTKYSDILYQIIREIPRAKWVHACIRMLMKYVPDDHLIIGGYLDAWLFNLVMSYGLKFACSQCKVRRKEHYPFIRGVFCYMDDCVVLGSDKNKLLFGIRLWSNWLHKTWHIRNKISRNIIVLLDYVEERNRKKCSSPSRRGCSLIDIAGYRASRTHVTIRRRTFIHSIRVFTRTLKEIKEKGKISIHRARSIISRYGIVIQSNCKKILRKYSIAKLLSIARKLQSRHHKHVAFTT